VPLRKIFVVDPQGVDKSYPMWESEFGKQMKAFQSSIILREDGFEFLIPEVPGGDELTGMCGWPIEEGIGNWELDNTP
jgi:hypothetical protein